MSAALDDTEGSIDSWAPVRDGAARSTQSPDWLEPGDAAGSSHGWLAANPGLATRLLDELDYGLMLVTDKAQVRLANREARRECESMRCFELRDGYVHLPRESERRAFFKALAAASLGRRTMLSLDPGGARLSMAVVPVGDSREAVDSWATLLVIGRRQVCEPLSVTFFAREHRLTSAECLVLQALCDGLCPAQIATQSGVAVSTVRTHVTSVRLKTGARSIGELVRRVTLLPPIVSVLC